MNDTILEVAARLVEISEKAARKVNETAIFLAGLSHEERLDWLKEHRHRCPVKFKREIGGTVYIVNARFSGKTDEIVAEKVKRILNSNITH